MVDILYQAGPNLHTYAWRCKNYWANLWLRASESRPPHPELRFTVKSGSEGGETEFMSLR